MDNTSVAGVRTDLNVATDFETATTAPQNPRYAGRVRYTPGKNMELKNNCTTLPPPVYIVQLCYTSYVHRQRVSVRDKKLMVATNKKFSTMALKLENPSLPNIGRYPETKLHLTRTSRSDGCHLIVLILFER